MKSHPTYKWKRHLEMPASFPLLISRIYVLILTHVCISCIYMRDIETSVNINTCRRRHLHQKNKHQRPNAANRCEISSDIWRCRRIDARYQDTCEYQNMRLQTKNQRHITGSSEVD